LEKPKYEELEPEIKKFLNPANPKALMMLARGAAPLPPGVLVASWAYLLDDEKAEIAEASTKSLESFPENTMKTALATKMPSWALYRLGEKVIQKEELLEVVVLNESTPNDFILKIAASCSEKIAGIIANNQERVIETPEIVPELEKNPNNLKSTTDRLRQFLKLAGIFVPGGEDLKALEEQKKTEEQLAEEKKQAEELMEAEELSEEKRTNLTKIITTLNVGAKVKLALKGNKEARSILIKDSNKTVATSVLKSPRITENEVIHYSSLKNVADDVIRTIARNPGWIKNYTIKLNLINHPKVPPQTSMAFIKFLNLRDLQQVSKSKTVLGPVRKAAKQLLIAKRK
jgi:hypothetical protein